MPLIAQNRRCQKPIRVRVSVFSSDPDDYWEDWAARYDEVLPDHVFDLDYPPTPFSRLITFARRKGKPATVKVESKAGKPKRTVRVGRTPKPFVEAEHPRAAGGKFAVKPGAKARQKAVREPRTGRTVTKPVFPARSRRANGRGTKAQRKKLADQIRSARQKTRGNPAERSALLGRVRELKAQRNTAARTKWEVKPKDVVKVSVQRAGSKPAVKAEPKPKTVKVKVAAKPKAEPRPKAEPKPKAEAKPPEKPAPAPKSQTDHPNIDRTQKAYKEQEKYVKEEFEPAVKKLADEVGVTPEKYRAEMGKRLQEVVDDGDFYVRVGPYALPRIIQDGRFKTQFETGHSGGALAPDFRRKTEASILGSKTDIPDHERPVYGYLGSKDHGSFGKPSQLGVQQYGSIAVRLKPGVRDRATVTFGDSLSRHDQLQARPARAVDLAAAPVDSNAFKGVHKAFYNREGTPADRVERFADGHTYVEAQYHGGLKVTDIQDIAFRSRPEPELAKALKKAGIPWRVVK